MGYVLWRQEIVIKNSSIVPLVNADLLYRRFIYRYL